MNGHMKTMDECFGNKLFNHDKLVRTGGDLFLWAGLEFSLRARFI